ncbi:MAG TPA: glycosyltransferase family 39 protein [Candidatus Paceibacterota bacterium]|nr:glycosyltransferase family 39 protein [Verrucomicrobiota bacterium]HSA09863.1 glycosyltransferase family 39 protein [Candidatus Paceibacterota bacterium]
MISWLETTDTALFRVMNQSLANPAFDGLMPLLAGHAFFIPLLLAAGLLLIWKGGRRGRIFVLMLALALSLADGFVCNVIRDAIGRPRPGLALPETRALLRSSSRGSLPSAHAANWFAATAVVFVFYRRRWLPVAAVGALVAFSRVYNGVHYPGDVLVGAVLGAGAGLAAVWLATTLWSWLGRRWFPLWWARLPSLANPDAPPIDIPASTTAAAADRQWLRLGWLLIAGLLLFRLNYIASGTILLSEDEAYQWLWSKHLALSYFSKPLGIALIQFAGTGLWGDTELGVRFFAPVFAAVLGLTLLQFMAREVGARQGFLLLLAVTATPLLGVGSVFMTIDSPLVLCWTLAMVVGWRAAQPGGRTWHWLLAGLALGLDFLSKYSAVYQIACWALFFALWRPARAHLCKPGPYLALLLFCTCTVPVIIWNAQHDWITVTHVADNAGLDKQWQPTLRHFGEFLGAEFGLLNPVFFVAALWAGAAFWRQRKERPLWLYFFCMGMPVFLGHAAYALHSGIHPNWIAPAVLPMFCLMVAYWDARWRAGGRAVARWLGVGLVLGLAVVVVMHDSRLFGKIAGRPLPAALDPLRRVQGWKDAATIVEAARARLSAEGPPAFIIAHHYGLTGLLSFYLPAARGASPPLVYPRSSPTPGNQFYFWPEYRYDTNRRGQNAIFVRRLAGDRLKPGWFWNWLGGREVEVVASPPLVSPPAVLESEFETVTSLGVYEVKRGSRVLHRLHLFECRHLR